MTESLKFMTPEFQWVEAEIKGQKKCFVEGYISTIDADDYNEVVTMHAQEKILKACLNQTITMDVEHDEFIEGNQVLAKPKNTKIPVAKIVEATMKAKGVWVKAEINQDSGAFKKVWGSIKNNFLHSFSIAFAPLKAITKSVNGVATKFIDDLNLINVTLTGSPVNTNATFVPVMKAAIKSMDNTMVEENNNIEATPEVAPTPVEQVVALDAPIVAPIVEGAEAASVLADAQPDERVITVDDLVNAATKLAEDKATHEKTVADWNLAHPIASVEVAPVEINTDDILANPMSQIKSKDLEIKQLKEQNAGLKARLATPILKSKIPNVVDVKSALLKANEIRAKTALDYI
jgi:phage head maturation protease